MSSQCKDCKWFRCGAYTKHSPPRISPGARTTCGWPVPPAPDLPHSITQSYSFRWIQSGKYADPNWNNCPTWEAKDKP